MGEVSSLIIFVHDMDKHIISNVGVLVWGAVEEQLGKTPETVVVCIALTWLKTVPESFQKQQSDFIYALDLCKFKANLKHC